jgi:gamma-glutamylcyclotransferase (GGCT)/AIG2-like uncharacterized protein YtfP
MTKNAIRCNLLAVYGTLRRRSVFHKLPMAPARLQFFTRGLIRGRLFWQRTYPALLLDRGVAQVELFRIIDPSVLGDLDRYEGYDPGNLRASLFIRNQVLLLNPRVRTWVYFLNPQIPPGTHSTEIHHKKTKKHEVLKPEGILLPYAAKSAVAELHDRLLERAP